MLNEVQAPPGMAPPQPANYVVQNQIPQASYVIQNQPETQHHIRPICGVKYFSIITIVIAFIFCILGIIAIVVEAQDSYVANAIWTGVLFVLPTGLLGLRSYWKKNSMCSNVSYLVLNIITCVVLFHLFIYALRNACNELWFCSPEARIGYGDWYYYDDDECAFSMRGRIAVDALIAVFAIIQLVLCIITMSFTCYGTCTCCYHCCRPTPPPAVVQYTAQNGACHLVSVGGYQSPIAAYQPVSLVNPAHQGAQMAPQMIPVMAYPQMVQSHPMVASNVAAPQLVQGQGSVPNQSVPSNAPPVYEKEPMPPSTNREPDVAPSYGQTATGQFDDQKNLLETD